MDLSAVKRDLNLLLAVLGRQKPGKQRCVFHDDHDPSMDIFRGRDGVWVWKCHAGCGSGTIIDAVMRLDHAGTPGDALRIIERKLGVRVSRDEDIIEPRIDLARAEEFVDYAHKFLLGSFAAQELLLTKRGISNLDVVKRYRLGYIEKVCFKKWPGWQHTAWVLPVTGADGRLQAVKIHHQGPRDTKTPKCMWAPFGTYPEEQPRHGCQTLWPPPEDFEGFDELYLCPGELKALAMLSEGLPATSPTAGESSRLPPKLVARMKRAAPKTLFAVFDNDLAGRQWRDAMTASLQTEGFTVLPFALDDPAEAPRAGAGEDDLEAEWQAALDRVPEPPQPQPKIYQPDSKDRAVMAWLDKMDEDAEK